MEISDWFENNWIDLGAAGGAIGHFGRLLYAMGRKVAGATFARFRRKQVGALLRLSVVV